MKSTPTRASLYEFKNGITNYYSLFINLKDRSSAYVLDSTVQIRPIGWKDPKIRAALSDSLYFALKSSSNKTYKHEWIMNQTFFSEGMLGDIEWTLINETKTINGLQCHKAVTKKGGYPMLSAWYTKELPVSNGPSIFQGLPGLIVWAEDYFNTTQVLNIEYSNDLEAFNKLYEEKYNLFKIQKEKGKYYDKEPILLIKKGDLANYFYDKSSGK